MPDQRMEKKLPDAFLPVRKTDASVVVPFVVGIVGIVAVAGILVAVLLSVAITAASVAVCAVALRSLLKK